MTTPLKPEESIVDAALEMPAHERAAYLDKLCGNDGQLRQLVDALLHAHKKIISSQIVPPREPSAAASDSKAPGTTTVAMSVTPIEKPGDHIGRYKLLQQIGEGGGGIVYMAEQVEPVRRRVALKILKLGMDTRQVIARFEAERQALALMDHPNIAKVHDAGATATGRPYFVMELVRGIKITDYCDQNNLSTEKRLDLFIQVCKAAQHAHQKGVIHRDIKPSNILVTLHDGLPVPKVIDFGIAKATTGQPLTDKTVFTAFEQFIGTPAYMSPEQAEMSGLDIDTRSDIYSLGVLLYELLTGQMPFDPGQLAASGFEEMRRIIRTEDPLRPSTRLSNLSAADQTTVAKCRLLDAPKLIKLVRGDLDWIVMKCLEKDRKRRYETANGLASDLMRHLKSEPVSACPPGNIYRFQKLVRRNKVGFAATGIIILVLAAGTLVSTWQAVRATNAKLRALSAESEESRLRVAAQQAQAEEAKQKASAQQGLYESLVGQARATRLARRVGYRERVFDLLKRARALDVPQKDLTELRDEAVACLGDFVGLTPVTFTNFPTDPSGPACLDRSGKLAALGMRGGTIQVREIPSGKELALLALTNYVSDSLCFNSTGDQLFLVRGPAWFAEPKNLLAALPNRRLFSWASTGDGRWKTVGDRTLPGVWQLVSHGTDIVAAVLEIGALKPDDPETRHARFRLFNPATGAFVEGYDVTNALPADFYVWPDATPDGRFLVVETEDRSAPNTAVVATLYDWKTGQRLNQVHLAALGFLRLSADARYLAWLSEAGGAIYTVPGLERIGQFKESFYHNLALFSGDTVALPVFRRFCVRLWDAASQQDGVLLDEPSYGSPRSFSTDGRFLLTGGVHHARVYTMATPEKLELPAHASAVAGVAFSPDNKRVAAAGTDRVLRICDASNGRMVWETNGLAGPGQDVGYSPDGRWLVADDAVTADVCIWDPQTGQRLLVLESQVAGPTLAVEFSPDAKYLATLSSLDPINRKLQIYTLEQSGAAGTPVGSQIKPLTSIPLRASSALVFAPDSRSLAFWSWADTDDAYLYVWDFDRSTQPRRVGPSVQQSIQCESFTPDGHLLAMNKRGEVVTVDVTTGEVTSSFRVETPEIAASARGTQLLRLSPDGSGLAITSASGVGVEIWNPKAGKRLYVLPEEAGAISWLAWSPDSRRLAVARERGTCAIWDLDTIGQILASLGLNP
jgi:serine/threonine protein kinase/WD40 repeat protein